MFTSKNPFILFFMTKPIDIKDRLLSIQEYLEFERNKDTVTPKSEFVNGTIIDMPGVKTPHHQIAGAIYAILWAMLIKQNYDVLFDGVKVNNPNGNFYYPDVFVVKEPIEFWDDKQDVISNPIVIFEVLSEGTAEFDRNDKFRDYRTIPSMQEYILVAQDKCCVEHFYKNDNNEWVIGEVLTKKSQKLKLHSIDVKLHLKELYQKVKFGKKSKKKK